MENEQIATILEREGLSASQLAERLGVQRALISHLQNNRNRVSIEIVKKIHHVFPHISLTWLIDHEGEYLDGTSSLSTTPSANDFDEQLIDTLAPVRATDKSVRKVVEIKVFFDDGTYETFLSTSRWFAKVQNVRG